MSTDVEMATVNNDVSEKKESDSGETKNATLNLDATRSASFQELFEYSDGFDIFCMFIGTLGALIIGASLPIFIVLLGQMLDDLNSGNDLESAVAETAVYFVIVGAVNVIAGPMQVCGWSVAGERLSKRYKEKYVYAILSQEVGWFDTCGAGELSTRVADLGGKLQDGMTSKLADVIQKSIQFITSFGAALYLCWQLTVVLLAAFPLIAGAGYMMIQAVSAAQGESAGQYAKAGGCATETLNAIRTVTALNDQPGAISKYRHFILEAMRIGLTKSFKVGFWNGLTFCVSFGTYGLGFWYGAKLVADQMEDNCTGDSCLTGGDIVSVFFCVIIGASSLGQLVPPLGSFVTAKAAAGSMVDVIKRKPLIDGLSSAGLSPAERPKGQILLQNIQFAYPSRPNLQICNGYSLNIEAGQTVALCGPSGAGKSTIINLLLRFYDPQGGNVLLDGTDVRDLNIRWLRSCIGYVGQEPVLFAGTIADNIAYGIDRLVEKHLDDATVRERVYEAAKQANAHDFISQFPKGYDTDVGGSGSSLSGGQKQRIAIARALIKKPAVLLLDEATSALDAASEKMVQQSINALQQKKAQTTIIIAHRLSTIRNADKIAVVNGGVVAELGTHDELIAQNGLYSDLVKLQMLGHLDEDDEEVSDKVTTETVATPAVESSVTAVEVTGHRRRSVSSAGSTGDKKDLDVSHKDGKVAVKANTSTKEEILAKDPNIKAKIWALVMPNIHWFLIGLLGAAMVGGAFPVWGLILATSESMFYLSDHEELRRRSELVARDFTLLGINCLIGYTLQYYGIAKVGQYISTTLRSNMFESLMRREIGFFDEEKNATGALTTRLADDARILHKATGETLANQFQAIFTLGIGVIIAFTSSWKISLVVLSTFPISIAGSAIQMKARTGSNNDTEGLDSGDQGAIISAAFIHMRTVSAFSMQHKVSEQYAEAVEAICKVRQQRSVWFGAALGFSQSVMYFNNALLFWYGAQLITHDGLSFQKLMTAMLSLMLGALGLGQALNDVGDQTEGLEAAQRIFTMMEAGQNSPIDGLSAAGDKPSARPQGRIELQGVQFSYPTRPDVQVCNNYNLVIEPGEVVALVGPSGSGKSTIMNLLLRFYDPLVGSVLLDGQDIKSLNVRWLRSQIGYVGQEPVLFSGSVADNVAKGRPTNIDYKLMTLEQIMAEEAAAANKTSSNYEKVTQQEHVPAEGDIESNAATTAAIGVVSAPEDVVSACIASNAHDFISTFPQGYGTDVGEGSIMVSGGQKQRIAIARALIKKPAVLLLDEATSALDAASEKLVQQSIDELQTSHQQTTIIIAHRLSTIRNADKIAVIDKGAVVEIGTHDQLLAQKGLYHELWSKQSGVDGAK